MQCLGRKTPSAHAGAPFGKLWKDQQANFVCFLAAADDLIQSRLANPHPAGTIVASSPQNARLHKYLDRVRLLLDGTHPKYTNAQVRHCCHKVIRCRKTFRSVQRQLQSTRALFAT